MSSIIRISLVRAFLAIAYFEIGISHFTSFPVHTGLRTSFETKHFFFLVMELILGGKTIDKFVHERGTIPEDVYAVTECTRL